MITIDGLISGLDTESIVQGLLEIQQAQLDRLAVRKQEVVGKQSAFQALEAHLITFRGAAGRLSRVQNNVFESKTISVSNENALLATARSSAASGVYQITVESLAQAHQVATQGFAEADAAVTHGTLILQRGDRPPTTITIDESNDTLQGLADTINLADAGISASLVQDASQGTPLTRLLLTSNETGTANAISVTNNLASDNGTAVQPVFDFNSPVQEATDSAVRLGSGAGALLVQNDTNRVDNLISGVTLDLLQADVNDRITIRVTQDTESAVEAVQTFVETYNTLVDYIDAQTRFEPESGAAGPLLGNRSILQIESQLQTALQNVIPGANPRANRLSALGISVTDAGKLTLNTSELQQVLNGEVDGVATRDLRRLFALDGASTNSNLTFVLGSSRTKESTTPYEIDITQAAERATIRGTNSVAPSTVIDETNNQLSLTIDGANIDVTLSSGTYTVSELADELESVINAHPDMLGRSVSVGTHNSTFLEITSDSFGSSSQVTIQSGTAFVPLGFGGTENDVGVDVEGHFIVDGVIEQAKGRGRVLSGLPDNDATADLQVRVSLAPAQVVAGVEGELTITRGFGARLDQLIGDLLDSETGRVQTVDDGFTEQIDGIQASIDRQTAVFEDQQQDLIAQFVALERAIGELQTTSSFLASQFSQLGKIGL